MGEEYEVAAHVAALTRVQDELVAELETTGEPARYAELHPPLADVEWALSRARASETNSRGQAGRWRV